MSTSPHLRAPGVPAPGAPHEHAWVAESRHVTTDGVVLYVRCTACAVRRIDLQAVTEMPPEALTRSIGGRGNKS